MKQQALSGLRTRYKARIGELGLLIIEGFHYLSLFVIGASIALSRLLIADVQSHHQVGLDIVLVSAAILLLTMSTRLIHKPSD
jgi:phosphate starvation-inducible membrane PsiE